MCESASALISTDRVHLNEWGKYQVIPSNKEKGLLGSTGVTASHSTIGGVGNKGLSKVCAVM